MFQQILLLWSRISLTLCVTCRTLLAIQRVQRHPFRDPSNHFQLRQMQGQ
jgi:hypothetical protein